MSKNLRTEPVVSIIVPVFNEAAGIVKALERLQPLRRQGAEIVVVDGGSRDATVSLATPLADHVQVAARSRGHQLNVGASLATGDILLFLHADTRLPDAVLAAIRQALAGGGKVWGRFDVRIDGSLFGLGLVAFMMNWRSRLSGIATGDQGIFVTRRAFAEIGGFPEIPLMEDIVFSRWLRGKSWPACLRLKVVTSGRRWEKHGLLPTIFKMWWLRLRFFMGASPNDLAREYGYAPQER